MTSRIDQISNKVFRVEQLNPDVPDRYILSRLKFSRSSTVLDKKDAEFYRKCVNRAKSLCLSRGAYAIFPISQTSQSAVSFGKNEKIESSSIAKFLNAYSHIVLMATCSGSQIISEIESTIKAEEGAKALIMDSAASEIVDIAMDELGEIARKALLSCGLFMGKRRFSPGYGDLGLDQQILFHRLLELDKIGISVSQSFQLIPEKSVTAIAGASASQIQTETDLGQ